MPRALLAPLVFFLLGAGAVAAFDVDDVALGDNEAQVKGRFPHAHCRALEWRSRAAERRCDDSRIKVGGIDASVTFYLKRDAVEGIDLRFERRSLEPMLKYLRTRYGDPRTATGTRFEWKSASERARLDGGPEKRRASLLVWRGDFERELYKIP